MKADRKFSLPYHMPLPNALKFTGARKPSRLPNKAVKLPEKKMFLPRPATYPES